MSRLGSLESYQCSVILNMSAQALNVNVSNFPMSSLCSSETLELVNLHLKYNVSMKANTRFSYELNA